MISVDNFNEFFPSHGPNGVTGVVQLRGHIPNVDRAESSEPSEMPSSLELESSPEYPRRIRVVLMNQHPLVRSGLRYELERSGLVEVVGDTGNPAAAIELVGSLHPDIVLLDVSPPEDDGVAAAAVILRTSPAARIGFVCGMMTTEQFQRAARIGARAFILNTDGPEQFLTCIDEIYRGNFCCSTRLMSTLNPGPNGFTIQRADSLGLSTLTPREEQMLLHLVKGASLKQAAISIGVSYKAADHIKQSLMKKLGIHDRVALVRFAMQNGLIS